MSEETIQAEEAVPAEAAPVNYYLVGQFVQIGYDHETPLRFQRFGQSMPLTPELALAAHKGRAALLPEPLWNSIGFTPQEVRGGLSAEPTPAFTAKVKQAWALLPALHEAALRSK